MRRVKRNSFYLQYEIRMQLLVVLVVICVCAVSAHESLHARAETLFEQFIKKQRKGFKYSDAAEHAKRLSIFKENMKEADVLNEKNGSPVFGVTK